MRWIVLLSVLVACDDASTEAESPDTSVVRDARMGSDPDGPRPDSAVLDADLDGAVPADAGAEPIRDAAIGRDVDPSDQGVVDVEHVREMRGVWIASVFNINFPSRSGLGVDAMQAELRTLLDAAASANLNAVFFQVRPEGDALYRSELEPFSRYLTGRQGDDPGFDPLSFAIAEAHARGLELHAWLNPYRAAASANSTRAPNHMAQRFAEYAYTYNGGVWMDPSAEPVRAHTIAVIRDLVERYDLDGVHFDDYFYPYPDNTPFPDDQTFTAYQNRGGSMGRNDWRRDNVNQLVEAVAGVIEEVDPDCRFGISPFGIYRPGIPEGIVGLDQYDAIFADPVRWMEAGWVDYVAPQLYWNATRPQQDYETLLRWWTSLGDHEVHVGNYLSKLGESGWDVDEFRRQLRISRDLRGAGSAGNIYFHIEPLVQNQAGIVDMLVDEFYQTPVLTPVVPGSQGRTLSAPAVDVVGGQVRLSHPQRLRAWVFYRGGSVDSVRWAPLDAVELPAGDWAISAVDRAGVESPAVPVRMP